MSNAKLDAVNAFSAATRDFREMLLNQQNYSDSDDSSGDLTRRLLQAHLEVVRAAYALRNTPTNSEAEKIAGKVLLERIDRAVEVKSEDEWKACAAAAIEVAGQQGPEVREKYKTWTDAAKPVTTLGLELLDRSQQQSHEIMMEGFRQAAEQTPGVSLRATEVIDDQVIRDEMTYGPAPGEEDSAETKSGRLSHSEQTILGLDDEYLRTDIERLRVLNSNLVTQCYNLSHSSSVDDVRLKLAGKIHRLIEQDLWVADVTGHLSAPIRTLDTQDFPALRYQLLTHRLALITEGSIYSRFKQGDQSAAAQMIEFVLVADMIATAKAYFLPAAHIDQEKPEIRENQLLAQSTFFVYHDTALPIGGGFSALGWVFATDENGEVYDAAQIIRLHDDQSLEMSWCSLRQGEAAPTAQAVVATLTTNDWEKPKALHLPGESGSKKWKQALVRSATRAKNGALHGLHTLVESD